jgi:hypothetical protein
MPAGDSTRRLFGWRLLAPCLLLSVLAFGAAAFYLGWSMREASVGLARPRSVTPPEELPIELAQSEGDLVSSKLERDFVRYMRTCKDHTHEVIAIEDTSLQDSDAYRLGVSVDHTDHRMRVHVSRSSESDEIEFVWMTREGDDPQSSTHLQFLLKQRRVVAWVSGSSDAHAGDAMWEDVNGTVSVSSWEWPHTPPVVISYDLYGKCGGFWRCAHDKIVLDR